MIVLSKKLRLIFSVLLMLSFNSLWAAEGVAGATGSSAGASMSSGTSSAGSSSIGDSAPAQVNTPSVTVLESATKSQEQESKADSTTGQDVITGISESQFKSEFQTFVAQSTGQALPMYGYNLFRKSPKTFAPVDRIPVTSDYTIGPGDELLVRMWGQVDADLSVMVDRDGMISLPKVGQISVVGVRYQNLQKHLKAAVSRNFQNFELDVSLGKLRSIQVFVVGQAARPGNYTVSSLSTLVNALFASGGPSARGSMRHIQLKRSGKIITEFDMYDLLLKGDKSKDVQLLSGDVIYIPTIGAMAAVVGSVSTPAIFELKGGENLSELLKLAGGLTNVAAGQKVSVERIHERETRKVDEFELSQVGLKKLIQDGDLVTVYSISSRFDNAVTLRGNIAIPGRHPWKEGMRVSDVIPDKGALLSDTYWRKQNQTAQVDITGSGSLRNEVKRNLAEVNWDYAVIERLNSKDLTTSLIPFNLGKAVIDHDVGQDLLLQAGDTITIFSVDDIQVPVANRTKYVVLEGELARPGVYQVQANETLRGLVARVGGLSPQAYLFGSEFSREATRQMQQKRLDEILARMEVDVQRSASQLVVSSSTQEEVNASKMQIQAQQALIAKMKQVKATGRIVLEMPEYAVEMKNLPDLTLEDGDRFYVPPTPSTVSVMGTVYNQNAFIFKKGKTVNEYVEKAGGPTRDGDEGDMYLVRADGLVYSKRQSGMSWFGNGGFGGRKALPGDTVVVPEKLEKYNLTKDFKDWTQIFYQFAIGIASLKTIGVF
jgi:polysaccharide biosynthesis/export protein